MREFNELIGIIEGVNFDGVVNKQEVSRLELWLSKNKTLVYDSKYTKMIQMLEDILEDHVVDEQEQKCLAQFVEDYFGESIKEYGKTFELNGIIDGIICDDIINEKEVYRLNDWVIQNKDYLESSTFGNELQILLNKILEDKVVSIQEQKELLAMLKDHMKKSYFESKLKDLYIKVKRKENIGLELIDLLDNEEYVTEIHRRAEKVLQAGLNNHSVICKRNQEIIFISLSLIAMLNYDGGFYEGVEQTYVRTYTCYNSQKIEGFIRSLLNDYYTVGIKNRRGRLIAPVLENAIVPSHFLKHFFEFIYDIYKVNFNYSLPEDLYSEFKFIYDGLRSKMLGENDIFQAEVTNKSYKLIKTTQQLIIEGKNIDSIINLSIIVIKLIDKKIWNDEENIYNQYLNRGYQDWVKILQPIEFKEKNKKNVRSRWKCKFELKNNDIYIVPPIHQVEERYDYRSIHILVQNNDEIVYVNKKPKIRAIFGGYEIDERPIKIDTPIGKLRYKLMSDDIAIYDSKDILYRDFLFFNLNNNEIRNNTNFTGTVVLCSKKEQSEFQKYKDTGNYILSTKNVYTGDVFLVEGKIFNFSEITKPGLLGETLKDCVIKNESNQVMPVFHDMKALVFECDEKYSVFKITLNYKTFMLKDNDLKIKHRFGIKQCIYDFDVLQSGIYSMKVYVVDHNHEKKIFNQEFAIDKKLSFEKEKIQDGEYYLDIHSDLMGYICKSVHSFEEFESLCDFTWYNKKYTYFMPSGFAVYKLDDNSWESYDKEIWIGDIRQGTELYLADTSITQIQIKAYDGDLLGAELELIDLKKEENKAYSRMDFLNSFKSYDEIALLLFSNGEFKGIIDCYNRCTVNEEEVQTNFDSARNVLNVKATYHGRGKVYYEIKNLSDEVEYRSDYLISGQMDSAIQIESLKDYRITFFEKSSGLSLNKNRALLELRRNFFVMDDLPGHQFELIDAKYEKFLKKRQRWLKNNCRLNNTYIKFLKRKSNSIFEGEIYTMIFGEPHYLTQINPVEIEISSGVIDNTIELLITNEGDGLYLNKDEHTVLDCLDDMYANDILLYIMSLKEVD